MNHEPPTPHRPVVKALKLLIAVVTLPYMLVRGGAATVEGIGRVVNWRQL